MKKVKIVQHSFIFSKHFILVRDVMDTVYEAEIHPGSSLMDWHRINP